MKKIINSKKLSCLTLMVAIILQVGLVFFPAYAQPPEPVPAPDMQGDYLYILMRDDINQPGIIFHQGISRYGRDARLVNNSAGLSDSVIITASDNYDLLHDVAERLRDMERMHHLLLGRYYIYEVRVTEHFHALTFSLDAHRQHFANRGDMIRTGVLENLVLGYNTPQNRHLWITREFIPTATIHQAWEVSPPEDPQNPNSAVTGNMLYINPNYQHQPSVISLQPLPLSAEDSNFNPWHVPIVVWIIGMENMPMNIANFHGVCLDIKKTTTCERYGVKTPDAITVNDLRGGLAWDPPSGPHPFNGPRLFQNAHPDRNFDSLTTGSNGEGQPYLQKPPLLQGRHMWVMVWDEVNAAWLVSNAMVPANLLCANNESGNLTVMNKYIAYGYNCLWSAQATTDAKKERFYFFQNNAFPGKVLTTSGSAGLGMVSLSEQIAGDKNQWWFFTPVSADPLKSGYGITVNDYHDLFIAQIVGVRNYGHLDAGSLPGLDLPIAVKAKTDQKQQQWLFVRDKENGFYEIQNRKSFLNMTPHDFSMESNGIVVSGPGPDAGAVAFSRLWRLIGNPDGQSYRLANVYSGLFLRAADLPAGGKCQRCVMQSEINPDIRQAEFSWWIHGYGSAIPPVNNKSSSMTEPQ